MSPFDFRQITNRSGGRRAERLFCAAVSAFCALTRPTRRDIAQLDDLALPLYDCVSAEARRQVSAALSECAAAPAGLIRRLADDTIDIAAPVLMKSPLSDVELIALIGRHGIGHARAIGARAALNPVLVSLLRALGALPQADAAETVREKLRLMMRPALPAPAEAELSGPALYARLLATALTGIPGLLQTALADALGLEMRQARTLTAEKERLLPILKGFGFSAEQAFTIAAAGFPGAFAQPEAIRRFLSAYAAMQEEDAQDAVRRLRAGRLAPPAA